jgi:hypothetical protein
VSTGADLGAQADLGRVLDQRVVFCVAGIGFERD